MSSGVNMTNVNHDGPCTSDGKTRCPGMTSALNADRGISTSMLFDHKTNKLLKLIVFRNKDGSLTSLNFCPYCGTRFDWSGIENPLDELVKNAIENSRKAMKNHYNEIIGGIIAILTSDHPKADECTNCECSICSIRDCPHFECLHYHHDGCPACSSLPEPVLCQDSQFI